MADEDWLDGGEAPVGRDVAVLEERLRNVGFKEGFEDGEADEEALQAGFDAGLKEGLVEGLRQGAALAAAFLAAGDAPDALAAAARADADAATRRKLATLLSPELMQVQREQGKITPVLRDIAAVVDDLKRVQAER